MTITVRNVDEELFREFKVEAVKEGIPIGNALNMAIIQWISKHKDPRKSLLDYKPTDWGKGTEHVSEEIDEILYSKK